LIGEGVSRLDAIQQVASLYKGREEVQPCDVGHYPEPLRARKDEAIATKLESVREILAPALSTIREVIADQDVSGRV